MSSDKKSYKSVCIVDERSSRREPSTSSSSSYMSGTSSNRYTTMDSSSRSSGSRDAIAYRSSTSSTKRKDVSCTQSGTVVVNEHSRTYDRNAPHPGYSSGGSSKRHY